MKFQLTKTASLVQLSGPVQHHRDRIERCIADLVIYDIERLSQCTLNMAVKRTTATGTLTSVTNAPSSTAKPPSNSVRMVNHVITCGAGTPKPWRMLANASGPFRSLA